MDILDAVIGLGPNLFYGAGLSACILVFRKHKPKAYSKKLFIIDASKEYKAGRSQNELLQEHIDRIYNYYALRDDLSGVCRNVSHDEIEQNNYNLNISRYIQSQGQDDAVSLEDAISRLRASFDRAIEAEDKLKSLLDKSVDRG